MLKLVRGLYRTQKWLHRQPAEALAEVVQNYFPAVPHPRLVAALARYKTLAIWGETPILPIVETHLMRNREEREEVPLAGHEVSVVGARHVAQPLAEDLRIGGLGPRVGRRLRLHHAHARIELAGAVIGAVTDAVPGCAVAVPPASGNDARTS